MLQARGLNTLLPHRCEVSQQLAQQLGTNHGANPQLAGWVDAVLVGDDGRCQRLGSLQESTKQDDGTVVRWHNWVDKVFIPLSLEICPGPGGKAGDGGHRVAQIRP